MNFIWISFDLFLHSFADKSFNDMVPQLIPREPVNIDGVKAGFTSVRPNISSIPIVQHHEIDIDPTRDAPIAVFDGKFSSLN